MTVITTDSIEELLYLFSKKGQYDATTGEQGTDIHKRCEELFEKDYVCSRVANDKGSLSPNYPSWLIIPTDEKPKDPDVPNGAASNFKAFDAGKYREISSKSNKARCRRRFPVPVILCNGKFICRSATIASNIEIFSTDAIGFISESSEIGKYGVNIKTDTVCSDLRGKDIQLLRELSVNYICDLMVENKKVKYGLIVSSSEKIDKEKRYEDFKIVQIPYPGCEFFKDYKDNKYDARGLQFDWAHSSNDASLYVPHNSFISALNIVWSTYKSWDLIKLTQNYLKLLLTYINEGTSSILIHCISGWDRTPLFVSLLRLTLWADGKAHPSLTAIEIAYLTLAYDWYLFGHDLPSRIKLGEEIMFFCIDFLKFIQSEEFSLNRRCRKISSNCAEQPLCVLPEEYTQPVYSSSSIVQKPEPKSSSTFYTSSIEEGQEALPSATFYPPSHESEDDTDSVKSGRALTESSLSENEDYPPTMVNSLDGSENNNGGLNSSSTASIPVPVPSVASRTRFDSNSSIGSWQYVSGCGSLDSTSSHFDNLNLSGGAGGSPSPAAKDREEKLVSVRTILSRAYDQAVRHRNSKKESNFFWNR